MPSRAGPALGLCEAPQRRVETDAAAAKAAAFRGSRAAGIHARGVPALRALAARVEADAAAAKGGRLQGFPRALLGPKAFHVLCVVRGAAGDDLGDDDQLRVLGLVVPDRATRLRWDTDGAAALDLDDLVPELELQLPRGDEVDLLLLPVPVAVRPLAARVLGHAPVGERDLLSLEVGRHHAHLAGVVPEHVRDLLEPL